MTLQKFRVDDGQVRRTWLPYISSSDVVELLSITTAFIDARVSIARSMITAPTVRGEIGGLQKSISTNRYMEKQRTRDVQATRDFISQYLF